MSPIAFQPAGFRPPHTRGRVISINQMRRGLGATPTSFNLAPGGVTSATPDVLTALHINAPGTVTPANAYQRSLGIDHIVTAGDGTSIDYRADGSLWTPPAAGGTSQQMIAAQQALAAQNAPSPVQPAVTQTQIPSPVSVSVPVQPLNIPSPVQPSAPVVTGTPAGTANAPAGPVSFLSTTILGIPLWIWGVGAIGAYFLFAGDHGRY